MESLWQSWNCHLVPSVSSCPSADQTHSSVSKETGWEIYELECFASQSGITTPPSDELSANESEPDGQIFLKTTCLKVEKERNFG